MCLVNFSLNTFVHRLANVEGVCDLLANETHETDIARIAAVVTYLLDASEYEGDCIDIDYETIVEEERRTNWDDITVDFGFRQYTYHLCTQLGWYHSSNSRFQPFGSSFPSAFRHQACGDIFDL